MDYALITSPSQLEDYWPEDQARCPRRWVLRSVLKLPTIQRHSAAFGDVAHKVIERYMRSDDRGYDIKTGEPLELYPGGWDQAEDRFGKKGDFISPVEAGTITKLVKQAIDTGALYRIPNRRIEEPYSFDLETPEGLVKIHGYMDLCAIEGKHGEHWDHKTHKRSAYALSNKKIAKSVQMLCGALALYIQSGCELVDVTLRHIAFIKERGKERLHKRQGRDPVVTEADLLVFASKLAEVCADMIRTRRAAEGVKDVRTIEGPAPKSRACTKYGPCDFIDVCKEGDAAISPDQYRVQIQEARDRNQSLTNRALTAGTKTVSFCGVAIPTATVQLNLDQNRRLPMASMFQDRLAKMTAISGAGQAAAAGTAPPAQQAAAPAPKSPAAPAQQLVKPTPPVQQAAPKLDYPWADANCGACKGKVPGLNKDGNPCRICDATAQKRGVLPSSAYIIVPDGKGGLIFEPKPEDAPAEIVPATPAQAQQAVQQIEESAQAAPVAGEAEEQDEDSADDEESEDEGAEEQAPAPQPAPAPAPKAQAQATNPDVGGEAPRGPGRPKGARNKPKPTGPVNPPLAVAAQAVDSEAPLGFSVGLPEGFDPAKRTGMTLIVNAYMQTMGQEMKTVNLDTVFAHYASLLAQSQGVPNFYYLGAFRRRDALASHASEIAAHYDGKVIIGRTDSPDLLTFVSALRPYCSIFIDGSQR